MEISSTATKYETRICQLSLKISPDSSGSLNIRKNQKKKPFALLRHVFQSIGKFNISVVYEQIIEIQIWEFFLHFTICSTENDYKVMNTLLEILKDVKPNSKESFSDKNICMRCPLTRQFQIQILSKTLCDFTRTAS